jgi:uncharacterized membrane protein YfcA
MAVGKPSSWPGLVIRAVGTVLLVAVGARVAYEVLSPIVSGLVVLVMLVTIYAILLGTMRRK